VFAVDSPLSSNSYSKRHSCDIRVFSTLRRKQTGSHFPFRASIASSLCRIALNSPNTNAAHFAHSLLTRYPSRLFHPITPHHSRQRQKDVLQLGKVWSTQTSDGIPASRGIEGDWLATALVETSGDVVEGFWVGVEGWVDPADCGLAVLDAGFVDLGRS